MALFRCLNPATLSSINGAKVLTGELEPTSTLGINGDIYLQTDSKGSLLHFDEDFTDEGGTTWSTNGTPTISADQSKIGEWQSLINSPINEKTIVEPMNLYSGSDAPTSILGKDNDLYLRNVNNTLMPQIKINGSWQDLSNTSIEDIFFAKPIPAGIYGYTQLSYIKSDGNSWIDSKLKFTTDTEFEIGGRWNDISSTNQVFFGIWVSGGESLYGALQGKHWAQIGGTGTANTVVLDSSYHVFSANANGIYIDENSVGTPTWSNIPTGYDIPILARQDGGNGINCQATNFEFGYCKIWQGGNLIRDFVPCKRNYDNTIGLYDKVNDKFYQNNGTGEIMAGPVVTGGGNNL